MKWSTADDEFLRVFYPDHGSKWCAKNLARKPGQVRTRAHKLSVKTSHRGKKQMKITPIESQLIVEKLQSGGHPRDIAFNLDMSPATVYAEIRRRGLKNVAQRSRSRNLDDADEKVIVSAYTSGKTIEQIAKLKTISVSCVQAVLKRNNVDARSGGWYRFRDETVLEDIRTRYLNNEGAATIARAYGASPDAIISVLRRLGVKLRSRKDLEISFSREDTERILELYDGGRTSIELGARYGVCSATIIKAIRANGGTIRSSKGAARYGFVDKIGRKFCFRSTWERATAEFFDQNDVVWDYEVEAYDLDDGSTYLPDFFIYEDGELKLIVEVKGHYDNRSRTKVAGFRRCYSSIPIEVWRKEELRAKGLHI